MRSKFLRELAALRAQLGLAQREPGFVPTDTSFDPEDCKHPTCDTWDDVFEELDARRVQREQQIHMSWFAKG